MRRIPIDPSKLRFKIAQLCLRLLYGRRYHFISPWRSSGLAACIIFYNDKKEVLCTKRAGNIERAGWWQFAFGGHLDQHLYESFEDAIKRETMEEANIEIDTDRIDFQTPIIVKHQKVNNYIEHIDGSCLTLYIPYYLTKSEASKIELNEEASEMKWADKKGIQNLEPFLEHELVYINQLFDRLEQL